MVEGREAYLKAGSPGRSVQDVYFAVVFADDAVGDRETESRSFALGLGRKEGFKYMG